MNRHVNKGRTQQQQQHLHCDSCYSRRCRTRVEVSVSCAVVPCRLLCGAVFHLCKEEDHLLLCPNVREPCLNAASGCPAQLPRSSQAAHLQVCPASVVCCSMEWLRWPADDTNPHGFIALQDNVLKERDAQGEALDVAMALVDQSDLYSRLKMKPLYPELMEEEEEEEMKDEMKEGAAAGGFPNGVQDRNPSEGCVSESVSAEETAAICRGRGTVINREKYDLFEMMFSMDKRACDKTREGVMERLGQELTPQEYNMYLVHHGRMLLAFGQIEACTPKERDFVYGSLEPIEVQTLRSFKVTILSHRVQTESRGVDTSDLGASEEDWCTDEAATTLLGYAEMTVMGHAISESKGADGLYVDLGTQTHFFRSAPFKGTTTLADVVADKPPKLHLQLEAEGVNSRNNRSSCVFTFLCGHSFHRRELATHFRNVHSDIQAGLNGWFEQRCPLAYLGCTYSQRRFHPNTHEATVSYNRQLRTFNLRPTLAPSLDNGSPSSSSEAPRKRRMGERGAEGEDSLSSLPYEVLVHVASFLDSLSLSQLSLVSRLMRQVCSSLLQDRGMVTLRWEKKSSSRGGSKWRAKPVWEFSHLFSAVDSWHMADTPPISAHLKVCPYYQTSERSEPVPLPSMSEKERNRRNPSLIGHFTGNR
uniref:F-box protein 40 n=1 Tax=Kryptolebias marmoratus TaxID=37003 RepID=A0A3Q3AD13_KRYMA